MLGMGSVFVWGRASPWLLRILGAGRELSVLFGAGFLCTWMVFTRMSRGGASRCSDKWGAGGPLSGTGEYLFLV